MILGGVSMATSEDWMDKIESLILAPSLIAGGVAIIVAVLKSL
jgi:hypothetical protein